MDHKRKKVGNAPPPGLIASTTYKGKGKGVLYPRRNVGGVLISVT